MAFLLQTKRLLIRPFKDADLEPLFAYRNDPLIAKYQGWNIPYPRERALKWITNADASVGGGRFKAALELESTGEMIGDISFERTKDDVQQAHIGYTLARKHWHQGYATEAMQRLLAYLFDELELHRIVAETDVLNEPSWCVLERLGFRREAHLVENVWFRGAYASEYHYAMLKREWKAKTDHESN
jgi:RimJ/RimL family protein N-acetyltransferase